VLPLLAGVVRALFAPAAPAPPENARACAARLDDAYQALTTNLESFAKALKKNDGADLASWREERRAWRSDLDAAAERCGLAAGPSAGAALVEAYAAILALEAHYDRALTEAPAEEARLRAAAEEALERALKAGDGQ
jgi:hypothetical protein